LCSAREPSRKADELRYSSLAYGLNSLREDAMRTVYRVAWCSLALLLALTRPAFSQTTGSINGTVTDNTGAVLPGVTITASGPALMGSQTAITNAEGQYRFPTLPPGTYRLAFALAGFSTVVRESIVVQVGFTATVPVQLSVASLQETVTVSGASPVVDVQNTNIQTNFSSEMLKSIPSARDIWALIGVTPGVTVERFDVGGSRAGTQTDYQAYGLSGQVRVMTDGANVTEETGGAPYFDFGAFDEVQIGTDANDASMPTPGLMISTVLKSGGNNVHGELYVDYEHERFQARNVTDELRRLGVGEGSRITSYYDPNFNVGGPIRRDKFWYFVSYRNQRIGTTVTGFPADNPSDFEFATRLSGLTYKLTYQLNQNNKLSQWLQVRRKEQPHRDADTDLYLDAVFKQDSISPYGGVEWHRIVSPSFFFNTRFGSWGYNWTNYAYGDNLALNEDFTSRKIERIGSIQTGSAFADRTYRRRWQFDWTGTLYRDAWAGGDHAIKVGYVGEWETQRNLDDGYHNEVRLRFDSPAAAPFTVPWRVQLYNTPTVSKEALWHHGAFLHDQFTVSRRFTINAGLRWDSYRSYHPEQEVSGGPFRDFFYAGQPLPNGYSIPATYADFRVPSIEILNYEAAFGPRLGVAYDLFGDGKNVVKAGWGRYYHNPGPISDYNPIRNLNFTFAWNDLNRDRLFTPNELGSFVSSSGSSRDSVDPDIGHPYTDDVSVFFERQIASNLGGRVGFIYRKQNNFYETIEQERVASLFTLPRQVPDPGPDGIVGSSDDGAALTVFDIPPGVTLPPSVGRLETPAGNDRDYKSVELTVNKRMSDRWSLVASVHHTWIHDFVYDTPEDPNEAIYNEYRTGNWSFKVFGTYRAPWSIVFTPMLRHQSGDPERRDVDVTLRSGTFEYVAEGYGKYRVDNPTLLDTRLEKKFTLPRSHSLGVFFDAFNITNSNAFEAMENDTGRRSIVLDGERIEFPLFGSPTRILNPRVYRFGVKYEF
jgi:hypothetical protein